MKIQTDWSNLDADDNWEEKFLEYAIDVFPYMDAIVSLSDYQVDDYEIVIALIEQNFLKIGYYYEEMTGILTIFYFLEVDKNTYVVLGLDTKLRVEIESEDEELFQVSEEQYMELCEIKLN